MSMPRIPALLTFAAVLAACATEPATRCAPAETRELKTIEDLSAEPRAEIQGAYGTVEVPTGWAVNLCRGSARSHAGVSSCTDPGTRTRTEALDTAAATRTLDALLARRERLEAQIAAAVAACPAR